MARNETAQDTFIDCPVELAEGAETAALAGEPDGPMTAEEAQRALHQYEELEDTIREFEDERQWVVQRLGAWLEQQGTQTARLAGRKSTRTIEMAQTLPGLSVN